MINRNVVLLCATAIVVTCLGVVGWIAASGTDTERILGWAGTTIGPLIAGIAAYIRVDRVHTDTQQIKEQTNGTLVILESRLVALEEAAGLSSPPSTEAPDVTRDLTGRPPATPPASRPESPR